MVLLAAIYLTIGVGFYLKVISVLFRSGVADWISVMNQEPTGVATSWLRLLQMAAYCILGWPYVVAKPLLEGKGKQDGG